eukprot:3880258-Pleurochrysis_carterae.AAC.1
MSGPVHEFASLMLARVGARKRVHARTITGAFTCAHRLVRLCACRWAFTRVCACMRTTSAYRCLFCLSIVAPAFHTG